MVSEQENGEEGKSLLNFSKDSIFKCEREGLSGNYEGNIVDLNTGCGVVG